jgi:GT2 family glycosyltransferase
MTTQNPWVDIVVLNYNGWRDTIACLESLFRLEYRPFRVIVCDNGSPNESVERIEAWARGESIAETRGPAVLRALVTPPVAKPIPYVICDRDVAERGGGAAASPDSNPPLVIIRVGANLGFAGGNNVGIRYSLARRDAKYVMLLNNDTVVSPTCVHELVKRAEEDASIGAVGATMLDFDQPELVQAAAGGTIAPWHGMVRASQEGAKRGSTTERSRLDFISGACLLARLTAIETVGMLDERFFMYGEDQDFSLRLRRAGFSLAYASSAEFWHIGGGTSVPRSPFNDYHNVLSSLLFVRKHFRYLLPLAAAYSLYKAVLPKIVRGEWERLDAVMRGYRDLVRVIQDPLIIASREPATFPRSTRDRENGHRSPADR